MYSICLLDVIVSNTLLDHIKFRFVCDKYQRSISNWFVSIKTHMNNVPPLEVVDRVSEAQLQVGEQAHGITWHITS